MATKIVNLRLERKRKARTAARDKADPNAARHGQTKAARTLHSAQDDLEQRRLDGHRREDLDEPD